VWLVESVEDAYNFMMNWLTRFPQFMGFFIAGENYVGKGNV
jgi:hypothetical protein